MSEMDSFEYTSNIHAKRLLNLSLSVIIVILFIFHILPFFPKVQNRFIEIGFVYSVPFFLGYAIYLIVPLNRNGKNRLPIGLFVIVAFLVYGGAALDMIGTAIHMPTLNEEANPIARTLLDSGHPLSIIYAYTLIGQFLLQTCVCGLCVAFFRNYRMVVNLSKNAQPRTSLEFIKAALGGSHLKWRQFFFPLKPSELPISYYLLWPFTLILLGDCISRWRLGIDWLQLGYTSFNPLLDYFITVIPLSIYLVMLLKEYNQSKLRRNL